MRNEVTIALALLTSLAACDLGEYDGDVTAGGDAGPGSGPLPDAGYPSGCNLECHGDEASPAPPRDLSGSRDTASRGVGAHRNHLELTPTWHRAVACNDCHTVPQTVGAAGHIDDDDNRAELAFSALASTAGASPSFADGTCSGTYCHGATLAGGALTEPSWTTVDGSQDACGNCHGAPPPAPHPEGNDCGTCHPTIRPGTRDFLDPDSHINGVVDVTDGQACDSCHGSGGVSAPPLDLAGNTARTNRGVGAHRQHLGPSDWHRQVFCVNCHVVPTQVSSPGHIDGDNRAELPFDVLNPQASYAGDAARCDNLYCHGNGRDNSGTMVWTDDPTLGCTSCHATSAGGNTGLGGDHDEHFSEGVRNCVECHQAVASGPETIVGADLHINGQRDVSFRQGGTWDPTARRCTNLACHGTETW